MCGPVATGMPPSKSNPGEAYLKKTSLRFREINDRLDRTIRALFPEAERVFAYGIPGWRIARRRWIDPKSVKGTIDPNWVHIFLAERKAGITLHMWNPVDFNAMQRRKAELSGAGFKVMVGCLQFNRKSEYPLEAIGRLLEDVKRSLEADAKKGGAKAA